MMARGQWVTRVSAKHLSKQWGVSKTTVEHYAAEASRMVRMDRGPLDRVIESSLARLETITLQAMEKGDLKAAIMAIDATTRITGPAMKAAGGAASRIKIEIVDSGSENTGDAEPSAETGAEQTQEG